MDTNSLKPIKLLVQKGVPLPLNSLHTVLQSILSDPAALSAASADIFEFVSTILTLCQQLDLHKNSDLLCEAIEKAMSYLQSKESSVVSHVEHDLVALWSHIDSESLSPAGFTRLGALMKAEVGKPHKESVLKVASAFAAKVKPSESACLKPLVLSLVSMREQGAKLSAACEFDGILKRRLRSLMDETLGSAVEAMGLKQFVETTSFIVAICDGVETRKRNRRFPTTNITSFSPF